MIKKIIQESRQYLSNSPKFIKLILLIGFCRSISTILLLAYNINNVLIYRFEKGLSVFTVFQYFVDEISRNHILRLIIIIAILVLIGYAILFPMGISASIHFLKDGKNSIGDAIGKGANDFFTIFELNALAFSFGRYTYSITVLRLITLDVLNNSLVIGLIILRGIAVLFSSIFRQYAKYIIVIEKIGVFDAIKKSISHTITNMGITIKGVIIKFIISLVFYGKIVFVLILPLLIIYFLITSNFINNGNERIIRVIGIITLFITTYMMSIIQSFFTVMRYKIYNQIKEKKINQL